MVHAVEIDILGPLRVRSGSPATGAWLDAGGGSTPPARTGSTGPDVFVQIREGLPRRLLAALALRAGDVLSTDTLIDLLWDQRLPRHPDNALQMQMSYLRRTLAPASGVRIDSLRGGYVLVVDPDAVDTNRFEGLIDQAAALVGDDPAGAIAGLTAALGLWRGPPVQELAGHPFAAADVARLEELRLVAVERRNDLALQLGRHVDLIGELTELVTEYPLRERFTEQLVLALYRAGRQAEALAAYRRARAYLVDELGIEPGPALRDLEGRVLAQDPSLARPRETEETFRAPPSESSDGRPTDEAGGEPHPRAAASWLPQPLTRLIGREEERRRVLDLVRDHRAVTLTGPGGAGKTRLALAVAEDLAGTTPVWYVDLGGATTSSAAATVATTLGVTLAPGADPRRAVSEALAGRTGVLLLDTCEHVVAEMAALAATVLRRAGGVRVLATSRRPLNLTGEIAWPVPPLPQAPPEAATGASVEEFAAAELFIERARAVRPDFVLDEGTAADIVVICQSLDGLPLAIELAAARADVLSTSAIRARLGRLFDVLVRGGVDTSARQQTMRAAIDWSHDLLDSAQQRYFARLGIFPATFDLDAAAAVAPGDADPLSLLSALIRQSMVVAVGGDRYRMLDTIRAYARDALDPEDLQDVAHRHALHYSGLVALADPAIRGPDQGPWLARLRADVPNLRAALDHYAAAGDNAGAAHIAGCLAWFWTLDGMLQEAAVHLQAAATAAGLTPRLRYRVLFGLGLVEASLGHLDRAHAIGHEALILAEAAAADGEDAYPVGGALILLGLVAWARGDLHAAARQHEEAMRLADAGNDAWISAVAGVLRARTAVDADASDRRERIADGVDRAHQCGDRHILGIAYEQLARLELHEGNHEAALQAAQRAIEQHTLIGYPEGMVAALQPLGRALLATGDTDGAWTAHRRALVLATSIGHPAAVCEAIEDLAAVHERRDDHGDALQLLLAAQARRLAESVPARPGSQEQLDRRIADLRAITGVTTDPPPGPTDEILTALIG